MTSEQVDVAVVGGGPAGLAAATALARAGGSVTVLEREDAVGGVARHVGHTGYGLREFRRLLRGPEYAHRWDERARRAGVDVRTCTTATGWSGDDAGTRALTLTSPIGRSELTARAVVLATGTRERPRSARLVPGSRPNGVLTTGSLQRLIASGRRPGSRAVIVGAEHVSFSAVMTLAHAKCRTVAMVTPEARHQSYAVLRLASATRHRVPVLTGTSVAAIRGQGRVESVELLDHASGRTRVVTCDTVVFTGDWIPDHELVRRGAVSLDTATGGPQVDGALRTRTPGVFGAGNLLHGAETAAVCAESGAWVAHAVAQWLEDPDPTRWPTARGVPIECDAPLRWVSPNLVVPGEIGVPHGHFLARSAALTRRPTIVVHQGDRELWRGRLRRTVPSIPVHLPGDWVSKVEAGEPVRISMSG